MAQESRAQFELGYRTALDTAERIDPAAIEKLADRNFDLKTWASDIASAVVECDMRGIPRDSTWDNETVRPLIKIFGWWLSPFGDDLPSPTPDFARGFAEGMRDLWDALVDEGTNDIDDPEPTSADAGAGKGGAVGN
jgi:hypothetical protein